MQQPSLASALAESLATSWRMKARPEQVAPRGDWSVWLVLAGCGFDKTRTGAEWVRPVRWRRSGAGFAVLG
jgi:phage terminase large subunit-like protein